MKLAELLTRRVGRAEVTFTSKTRSPRRRGHCIELPADPSHEYLPLHDGDQFLFVENSRYWFGGTDENPFLVPVTHDAFTAFEKGGEQAFYDALKPKAVKEYEPILDVTALRQGDIFALPLPFYTWGGLRDPIFRILGINIRPTAHANGIGVAKEVSVFGTRHTLHGPSAPLPHRFPPLLIAEGTLTAPDHLAARAQGSPPPRPG